MGARPRSAATGGAARAAWLLVLAGTLAAQEDRIGALSLAEVAACFLELEQASARDGGRLWGVEVAGPVLVVDPLTRRVGANRPDQAGELVERSGVFVGTLPKDQPVANAPLEWSGVRWAMVVEPFLGASAAERLNVLAHESFHRVQPGLGLYVFGQENGHLDELDGRYWLQLEWDTLQAALAGQGEAQQALVRDALDFRAARRELFPAASASENALELREGLASYTGLRIAGLAATGLPAHVAERRAREDGFVRSFAYFSGPLYGYLLDEAPGGEAGAASWRARLDQESDLGALLGAALGLEGLASRAPERAAVHGGPALRAREEERERARQVRLAAWRADLLDGPVLVLDLAEVRSAAMDTRKVHVLEPGKLVFTSRKLIAAWGTLELEGGAILEDAATRIGRISLRDAAPDHASGPGWRLAFEPGWQLVPGERGGDFTPRKLH